jgi:hypothetical protein
MAPKVQAYTRAVERYLQRDLRHYLACGPFVDTFEMLTDLKDETLHIRIAGVDAPEVLFTFLYILHYSYHMAS